MRATAIIVMLVLALASCGHREKKAPCSPADGITSQQPMSFAPLNNGPPLSFSMANDCGPLKLSNAVPLDALPLNVKVRP
jgi:hypothetical protein